MMSFACNSLVYNEILSFEVSKSKTKCMRAAFRPLLQKMIKNPPQFGASVGTRGTEIVQFSAEH